MLQLQSPESPGAAALAGEGGRGQGSGGGGWMTTEGQEVSFRSNEKVLKLTVAMAAHSYEYTKNH